MSPGQPDAVVVQRHLLALDTAIQRLRRHAGRPLASLLADVDEQWTVERGLQLCAQNALDIATHLAASAGRDAPDYATAIDVLSEIGVVTADFAQRFRGVAGFRNVLVHGYIGTDLGRVHALLNTGLDDFVEFARQVESYLKRSAA
ncbi:MAG: DUF86 domain-containing protein [Candidatus Rokubacteria bacterium]|nr:DUF86 domain-containing protein [Candidatus Rokubacteria bacterium]